MFYPPAKPPHAAVAYRTTALDARRHDRAGGGSGEFFQNIKFGDCHFFAVLKTLEHRAVGAHGVAIVACDAMMRTMRCRLRRTVEPPPQPQSSRPCLLSKGLR